MHYTAAAPAAPLVLLAATAAGGGGGGGGSRGARAGTRPASASNPVFQLEVTPCFLV